MGLTINNTSPFRVLSLFVWLAASSPLRAQIAPAPIDPAVVSLARRIAEPLQKEHVTKVFVADLRGPEGQEHPVGKRLADLLSTALQRDFPGLQVLDRREEGGNAEGSEDLGNQFQPIMLKQERDLARKLGANVVVGGNFAKIQQGIGISLYAKFSSNSPRLLGETNGLIPISDEIAGVSSNPIPLERSGIAGAGIGGTTIPGCIHCPSPNYTDEARAAKYQGVVLLEVTVTADGRATYIAIVKGPGKGLDAKAVQAVSNWKFKPAVGPDGHPVAAVVPIEITFRLH
ncbi:MAG TPA: energy transducer TonB [Candidatus Cybelea sp.]|jgi:TonB family protein|nr:energy transducer TonB [Candidatus Cybelea sp.]